MPDNIATISYINLGDGEKNMAPFLVVFATKRRLSTTLSISVNITGSRLLRMSTDR